MAGCIGGWDSAGFRRWLCTDSRGNRREA